jgi:hypothetical protein
MKCFACDGSGVRRCVECFGEGECSSCQGKGIAACRPCDGTGERDPDSFSKKRWAKAPEAFRKRVEQYVEDRLPAEILAKLRDLHTRGAAVSSDPAFFHFGGGLAVRNLCRDAVSDPEMSANGLWGEWDDYYVGVLVAIAAKRQ